MLRYQRLPVEVCWTVQRQCRLASTVSRGDHRDIVIVGGGVAGLALATALLAAAASPRISSSCSIALIEGSDLTALSQWSPTSTRFENRVSSITADSRRLLERVGAWEHLDKSRIRGLASMQVWDGLSKARIRFDINDLSQDGICPTAMAWLTENANLSRALMRSLQQVSNVELVSPAKVDRIEEVDSGGRPLLTLGSGRQLQARLLVGADGFNSPVRKFAGVGTIGWAYDTHAVVATLETETSFDNATAFQRFLPSGPIAYLPLPERRASLVWSTRPAVAAALKKLDGPVLAEIINAGFRLPWHSVEYIYRLLLEGHSRPETILDEIQFRSSRACLNPDDIPEFQDVPPPVVAVQEGTAASFPLRYAHADAYVTSGRVALLGDAAHTVHPLAGQGLNLGLGDVEALSRVVEEAVEQGADLGSLTSLQPYARARHLPNHVMMSAVDKLHKIYSTTSTPIVWARSTGLEVLNELGVVKSAMMGRAGATGNGHRPSASQMLWGAAAQGVESAQSALTVATSIARRVASGLSDALASRSRM